MKYMSIICVYVCMHTYNSIEEGCIDILYIPFILYIINISIFLFFNNGGSHCVFGLYMFDSFSLLYLYK